MITLTLPYPISANRYWRHYNVRGRLVVAISAEAKKFKAEIQTIALSHGLKPLVGRLEARISVFPPLPKDWVARSKKNALWGYSVRCIDLDNAQKVMLDALEGILYENDNRFWHLDLRREIPDEHGARTEITIRVMDDETA